MCVFRDHESDYDCIFLLGSNNFPFASLLACDLALDSEMQDRSFFGHWDSFDPILSFASDHFLWSGSFPDLVAAPIHGDQVVDFNQIP